MLFTLIRDWFVAYVWGGYSSTGTYYKLPIGRIFSTTGNNSWGYDLNSVVAFNGNYDDRFLNVNGVYGMADWLSTTSTIVVMIGLCIGLYFVVRWLFRLTSGLILLGK